MMKNELTPSFDTRRTLALLGLAAAATTFVVLPQTEMRDACPGWIQTTSDTFGKWSAQHILGTATGVDPHEPFIIVR